MEKRIKELLKAGIKEEDVEKIIAAEEEVDILFSTITESLTTAHQSYKKPDMASLNVAIDNLNSSKKHITELQKKLEELRSTKSQPGAAVEPPEPVKEEVVEEVVE